MFPKYRRGSKHLTANQTKKISETYWKDGFITLLIWNRLWNNVNLKQFWNYFLCRYQQIKQMCSFQTSFNLTDFRWKEGCADTEYYVSHCIKVCYKFGYIYYFICSEPLRRRHNGFNVERHIQLRLHVKFSLALWVWILQNISVYCQFVDMRFSVFPHGNFYRQVGK